MSKPRMSCFFMCARAPERIYYFNCPHKASCSDLVSMHHPASAADARASLQKTLLHVCKVAAQEESAVICAALAAVKGALLFALISVPPLTLASETILATSAALAVAAKECVYCIAGRSIFLDLASCIQICVCITTFYRQMPGRIFFSLDKIQSGKGSGACS
jgi:hypothetical protein